MPVQEEPVKGLQVIQSIQNRIYEIRGFKVMLDRDLAALYQVPTKSLNLSVKRNLRRFPDDFMFQLTKEEVNTLELQIVDNSHSLRFQFETSNRRGGVRYLPYAFTEQGVAMLSGILNSDRAISMNIVIMRAFVEMRKIMLSKEDVWEQLLQLKQRLGEHDTQLSAIYDAIENLLDDRAAERKWENRSRIGFVK